MARVNRGRHVIIETATHTKLKEMCAEAGVLMTTVCDFAMKSVVVELMKKTPSERNNVLRQIAAGTVFAEAFAGLAEIARLADEGGTIIDKTREGEGNVTPKEGEGPTPGPPQ